jgi:hypothetical protein
VHRRPGRRRPQADRGALQQPDGEDSDS